MRFFDRENEIDKLHRIRDMAKNQSTFTMLTGRRRIGKTELVLQAFADEPFLYLFVTRSAEADLCDTFQTRIESFLGRRLPGKAMKFSMLFRWLLEESQQRSYTVVIDEFQDFLRVNPAIYSEMQREWDELNRSSRINLVVSGSINTLMNRLFLDMKEPLYGRQTHQMTLRAFSISTLKTILETYHPDYAKEDLLALWTYTGGVAKYVALLMDAQAYTAQKMLEYIVDEDSFFLSEGRNVLIDEFGRDYGTYFSILSAIARGKTSRAAIENDIGGEISGYLTRLENRYDLISKKQPLLEKTSNKNCLYMINDNFFRFWYRFIYKYQYLIQVRMFADLRNVIARDYEIFTGLALEAYFKTKFVEEHAYTRIGNWWDRKGENEIDLIGENEFKDTLDFYEIKREAKRLNLGQLRDKAPVFLAKHPELKQRKISFHGLSMDDM